MGTSVDGRSDIYALGCMLFETLTGAPPFGGTNPLEIMMQHGAAKVPSLKEASLGETFPPALERVILRMLAKAPKDRYQDCSAVANDLAAIDRGDFERISTSPGAITLRQQRRRQISSTLLGTIMGIVGGVTIGYAAHQFLTPSPPVQKKFADEGRGFYGLDTGFTYYSKTEGDRKIFEFPSSRKHNLGEIHWWQSGKLNAVPAFRTQTVPDSAKLIFKVESDMLVAPDLWPKFHPCEFHGIVIDLHSCYVNDEPLNQSMREITQQENLEILTLKEKSVFARTFYNLGGLSHLRWLDASQIMVDEKELTGELVSKLANLQDLRVLRLDKVESVTPALTELTKKNSLRRLALASDKLTLNDIKLVTRLHSLEVLSLRHNALTGMDLFAELGKLPNLRRLVVDSQVLSLVKPETLSKLIQLTLITDGGQLPPSIQQVIARNTSIKLIQNAELFKRDGDWFDPLKEDPAAIVGSN
jgi:hypothetical protein